MTYFSAEGLETGTLQYQLRINNNCNINIIRAIKILTRTISRDVAILKKELFKAS